MRLYAKLYGIHRMTLLFTIVNLPYSRHCGASVSEAVWWARSSPRTGNGLPLIVLTSLCTAGLLCNYSCQDVWWWLQARSQVGNRGVSGTMANLGWAGAAAKQPLLPRVARKFFWAPLPQRARSVLLAPSSHTRRGWSHRGWRTGPRTVATLPYRRYTRTRSSLFAKIRPGMMAIREMAVASVAAPMGDGSWGLLLITPKRLAGFCSLLHWALARLGNKSKRRQTLHTRISIRAHWYTWHISIISRRGWSSPSPLLGARGVSGQPRKPLSYAPGLSMWFQKRRARRWMCLMASHEKASTPKLVFTLPIASVRVCNSRHA